MRVAAALLVVVVLSSGGCADGRDGVTVLAASSLQAVATELLATTGTGGDVSAAGSHTLAAQVEAGAPGDVLLLADPELAARLEAAGLAGPPVHVASTIPVVAVAPTAADRVLRPEDLAGADLQVVLGDEDVPLGRYTRLALAAMEEAGRLPPGAVASILDRADSFEAEASLVVVKLTSGEADAAVVYESDLVALEGQVRVLALPGAPQVRYTAQVLTTADDPARARDLVRALTTEAAAVTWERFGFRPVA